MSDAKLYQEELVDHFKYPRNKKKVEKPDFSSGQHNPSCGDSVFIEGKIKSNKIIDLGFSGSGCVISQAATSMLTELCKGKTIDFVLKLTKDDITKMVGLKLGPIRLKCALLCLQALKEGLLNYKKQKDKS